ESSAVDMLLQRFLLAVDPDMPNQLVSHPGSRVFLEAALSVLDALLGAAVGAFFLWAAAALYKVVRKREGMGIGDVKMMALVGAFLGVRGAFLTILFGTLLGSIIGVVLILALYLAGWKSKLAERAHRRGLGKLNAIRWALASQYHLPLGTFLGIAALFE